MKNQTTPVSIKPQPPGSRKVFDRNGNERIPRNKTNIVKCHKCGTVDIELDMLVPVPIPESKGSLHYLCPTAECRTVLRRIFQRPKQYPPSQS